MDATRDAGRPGRPAPRATRVTATRVRRTRTGDAAAARPPRCATPLARPSTSPVGRAAPDRPCVGRTRGCFRDGARKRRRADRCPARTPGGHSIRDRPAPVRRISAGRPPRRSRLATARCRRGPCADPPVDPAKQRPWPRTRRDATRTLLGNVAPNGWWSRITRSIPARSIDTPSGQDTRPSASNRSQAGSTSISRPSSVRQRCGMLRCRRHVVGMTSSRACSAASIATQTSRSSVPRKSG